MTKIASTPSASRQPGGRPAPGFARKFLVALALAFLPAGPLAASREAEVMAAVSQLTEAFNQGDAKGWVAGCTDQMFIIDELPPHEWHGAGGSARWLADYDADCKKHGITDAHITLGEPRHNDVTGDRAYVVVPASYTYRQNGKPMKETGSTWTLTLQKTGAGWQVTGWAWAKQ